MDPARASGIFCSDYPEQNRRYTLDSGPEALMRAFPIFGNAHFDNQRDFKLSRVLH